MTYMAVNELKRSKNLWLRLANDKEVIVTRDGKPCAILVGVTPQTVEEDLGAVRRALFSAAVSRVRQAAAEKGRGLTDNQIAAVVRRSRRERKKA